MGRLFSSGVSALTLLIGGCAATPYSVGAAPDSAGLAHYQSGRPTLISRARSGVVEITPVASEFEDRIVLAVTAINTGSAPVNFGYENVGAIYEDGGVANLVPALALRRESRERARFGRGASDGVISATSYGVDATAIIDTYGRSPPPQMLGLLQTTTIDPRNMVIGLIVLEKPWLNDRVRTLVVNVELGGEGHVFRLALARRGVLLPLGGVAAAARFDTAEGLQIMPEVAALPARKSAPQRPVVRASLKSAPPAAEKTTPPARHMAQLNLARQAGGQMVRQPQQVSRRLPSQAQRQAVRFDPYARPKIQRGVIE